MNQLTANQIEYIHDVLVGVFLPFDEMVNPSEHRDRALIESAAARPFHTACGFDLMPTLAEKSAALFHSLACNHCFLNGNKRTAVIALDVFLTINDHWLSMNPDQVYELAKSTVTANLNGIKADQVRADLTEKISVAALPVRIFKEPEIRAFMGEHYDKAISYIEQTKAMAFRVCGTAYPLSDH